MNVAFGDLARIADTAKLTEGHVDEEKADDPEGVVPVWVEHG